MSNNFPVVIYSGSNAAAAMIVTALEALLSSSDSYEPSAFSLLVFCL